LDGAAALGGGADAAFAKTAKLPSLLYWDYDSKTRKIPRRKRARKNRKGKSSL
jgi:hypothetical protein